MKAKFVYDPRKQFSKWLAKSSSWFWYFYLVLLAVIMAVQPAVANAIIYIAITVSVVMIFHVWAYTKNSTYEKGINAMLDKAKMEFSLKNTPISLETDEKETKEEEGDNG